MDTASSAELLPSMQKSSRKSPTSNYPNTHLTRPYEHKPWNSRHVASNLNTETTSTRRKRTWNCAPSPPALKIIALNIKLLRRGSVKSYPPETPFVHQSFCKVCYDSSISPPRSDLWFFTRNSFAQLATIRLRHIRKSSARQWKKRTNCPYDYWGDCFHNRGHGGFSSSDHNSNVFQIDETPFIPKKTRAGESLDKQPKNTHSTHNRTTSNNDPALGAKYQGNPVSRIPSRAGQKHISGFFFILNIVGETNNVGKLCECAVLLVDLFEFPWHVSNIAMTAKPTYKLRMPYEPATTVMTTANCQLDTGARVNLIRSTMIPNE